MLEHHYSNYTLEVGTDEAGRGCLAGPVVAAAVILPPRFKHPLLNDSKQLSEKKRLLLRPIIEKEALAFAVAFVSEKEIDKINILNASIKAMHKAIADLKLQPEFIIVDGNKFKPYNDVSYKTIVKGDAKFMSIAAASVLAKTYRDDFMEKLHLKHPEYAWNKNKGYPTKQHRDAIRQFSATVYHRKSFRLLPEQLKLDL
ncbi:MAG: ribonuclease HII [Flavobacteriaceae bacterium]